MAEAGHELRTPLALLRAELDFALHHAETEEELRSALREASVETDRLVQLAGDLLLIASADEGGLALRLEPIRAAELLESVRNRFAWRAEEAGRPLEADAAPDLELSGDRLRLEQALGNLVENALRHGGGEVRISARRGQAGDVELHVSDRGPGFPDGFLDHAFDRFSQGGPGPHRGRRRPRTGDRRSDRSRSRRGVGGRQLPGPHRRLDRPSSGRGGLDEPLHLACGVLDQTAHLIVRLAEPGQHVLGHDLRIG